MKDLDYSINCLASFPCKNSIWSVVRRLCIADAMYHLWQERNTRLFQKKERSSKVLVKCIMDSVKSRLLTLKVRSSSAIKEVEEKWEIQLWKLCSTRRIGGFSFKGVCSLVMMPGLLSLCSLYGAIVSKLMPSKVTYSPVWVRVDWYMGCPYLGNVDMKLWYGENGELGILLCFDSIRDLLCLRLDCIGARDF
ncbi:hypothetical protein Tco_0696670 [Tanacetum coccineum]